jgi:hypothetical protein
MAKKKQYAIYCESLFGPTFIGIYVLDNCNANSKSNTSLGGTYSNDTGLDGKTIFTCSQWFQVREIEVFEITD